MSKILLLTYILFVYLVPSSVLLRPEYLMSFALTVIAVFSCKRECVSIHSREMFLFLLLSFGAILSVFFQNLLGAELIYRDLMVLVRYAYYAFAIISGGYIAYKLKNTKYLKSALFILIMVSALISVFQYHNVLSINNIMNAYFSDKSEALAIGYHWRRIIGTYGNPNYWGLFLNFCVIISLYFVVFKKSYIWGIPVLLLLLGIIYTGSRTTLVSLVISSIAIMYIIRKYKVEKISKNIIFAAMLMAVLAGGVKFIFLDNKSEIYSGEGRFSTDNITTLEMRIEHWHKMISHTFNHPMRIFIGGGESKGRIVVFGDNMYLKYFRDYGVIGLGIYLALLYSIYKSSLKILINNKNIRHYSIPFLWVFICFLVFDLAADSWFVVRITGLILFYYGFLKVMDKANTHTVEVKNESLDNNIELERRGTRLR